MKSRILKKFILVEALFFLSILTCVEGIASTVSDSLPSLTEMIDSCRTTIDLSGNWKLKLTDSKEIIKLDGDQGFINGYWKKDYDASSWKNVKVPHNWFWDGLSRADCTVGWYQKKVIIPKEYQGRRALIRFEGISYESDIWVNGEKAGNHKSIYATNFELDVTDYMDWGVANIITIRCSFHSGVDADTFLVINPARGRAGIWLKPSLLFVPSIYIKQVFINPMVGSSVINVEYWLMSSYTKNEKYHLIGFVKPFAEKGKEMKEDLGTVVVPPGLNKLQLTMKLKDPVCWTPDNPYLYNLFLVLSKDNKQVMDCTRTRFGFREFTIQGNSFYLNGKPFFLFGAETVGVWTPAASFMRWGGCGLTEEEERTATRDLFLKTKENRVNLLRGHPAGPSPAYVYEVADEVGLLYYEEIQNPIIIRHYQLFGGDSNKRLLEELSDDEVINQQTDEMEAWIKRNWNSPSLVMASFFNEAYAAQTVSGKLYDSLKPKVGDRIFLCASSGMYSWPGFPETKTDFFDIHNYAGGVIGYRFSWTYMEDTVQEAYDWIVKVFGKDANKPLIIGECPNNAINDWSHSFDGKEIAPEGKITPESYVRASTVQNSVAYCLQNNTLKEVVAIFHPEVFPNLIPGYSEQDNKVKRSVESLRRMDIVRGIVVNNYTPGASIEKVVYKPTFICSGIFNTNLFSGDTLAMDLYVINDCQEDKKDAKAVIEIISHDGKKINSDNIKLDGLKGSSRRKIPYTYKISNNFQSGLYDIKLYLYSEDKLLSNNYYDFYVLNKKELQPVITDKKVTLLVLPEDETGTAKTEEILNIMKVKYKAIPVSEDLYHILGFLKTDVLIIPAFYNEKINNWLEVDPNMEVIGKGIRTWVEGGGKLFFLEQTIKNPLPWVREWKIIDAGNNNFMDMAVPEHPVYKGMVQRNFDTWSGKGVNTRFLISPMSVNIIGSVAASSTGELAMAIAEAKVGKGAIVGSQLETTGRFMKDSCATKYLYNLISYVLGNEVYAGARELTGQKEKSYLLDIDKCFYIDLKPYVNRGFKDEVNADKEGGWTDQGTNDLRHIPVGNDNPEKKYWQMIYRQEIKDKQIFRGVPFEVIDPAKNNDKSCIVLAGGYRPYFPTEVKDIKVDSTASKLYFLHTSAWCTGLIAKYIIHYSDGTSETIDLIGGKNIAEWWGPHRDIEETQLAWAEKHPITGQYVGIYLMEWNNPHPDKTINSIDFVSSNNVSVPILLAITGVK